MRRLLGLLSIMVSLSALGQDAGSFPSHPIRMLVPAPAGGGADLLGRVVAARMSERTGWTIVVENRTGAGGNIAGAEVARAAPDGHTLLLGDAGQLAINGSLYKSMPFNALRDFTPIGYVASFPFVLVANPAFAPRSIGELVAYAKAAPGKVDYASTGIGSPQHLGGQMFAQMAGIEMTHIPFRGGAPALAAVLAGDVPIGFIGVPPTLAHVKISKLRALAISTKGRSALLPEVPTMAEAGFPSYDAAVWFGLVGPARIPEAIVQKLSSALNEALADSTVASNCASRASRRSPALQENSRAYMRSETAKWKALVEASGATAE